MKKQAAYLYTNLYAADNDQDDLINKSVYSVVIKVTGKQAAHINRSIVSLYPYRLLISSQFYGHFTGTLNIINRNASMGQSVISDRFH